MRIHLEGDWSAAWAFGLATCVTLFFSMFRQGQYDYGDQGVVYGIAVGFATFGLVFGILAKQGRNVPDGSTWNSWENTGSDAWWICGSAFFLYFSVFGTYVFVKNAVLSSVVDVMTLGLVSVGLLVVSWGIAWLNFSARIMVFTPEKDVLLLKGRPCSFITKKFRSKECVGLHVSWDQGYAGGMYHDHPDNLYFVWGIYPEGPVKLNTVNIPMETKRADGLKMIRNMVEETAAMVGQPVPPWPKDDDIYLRLDR